MASRPYQMRTSSRAGGLLRPPASLGIKPRVPGTPATKPRIVKPPAAYGPHRRRAPSPVYEPWPVFDRALPQRRADPDADSADVPSGDELRMTWSPPETLDASVARTDPGLFIIERRQRDAWLPAHVGMAPLGIGQPLRWLAAAPALLGVAADLGTVRIRPVLVTIDPFRPRDRAVLRALRDHVTATISASGPAASRFTASPRSPGSEQILSQIKWKEDGVKPPYLQ